MNIGPYIVPLAMLAIAFMLIAAVTNSLALYVGLGLLLGFLLPLLAEGYVTRGSRHEKIV